MSSANATDPMVEAGSESSVLSIQISSQMEALGHAVDVCREFLGRCGVADCSSAAVVFRELIVNAIVHGNRLAPSRVVRAELECLGGGRFRFSVEDEGEGFSRSCIETEGGCDSQGRIRRSGYVLVSALTESIEIRDGSSRVTVIFGTDEGQTA